MPAPPLSRRVIKKAVENLVAIGGRTPEPLSWAATRSAFRSPRPMVEVSGGATALLEERAIRNRVKEWGDCVSNRQVIWPRWDPSKCSLHDCLAYRQPIRAGRRDLARNARIQGKALQLRNIFIKKAVWRGLVRGHKYIMLLYDDSGAGVGVGLTMKANIKNRRCDPRKLYGVSILALLGAAFPAHGQEALPAIEIGVERRSTDRSARPRTIHFAPPVPAMR